MPSQSINRFAKAILESRRFLDPAGLLLPKELLETQVYIGLNDANTKKQERETESYLEILKKACADHGVPFSFDVINGGYIHDDGEFTEENTVILTFIDVDQEAIDEIARDLCRLFNQESVLITTGRILVRSVSASND